MHRCVLLFPRDGEQLKKKVVVLGATSILIFLVFSGCITQHKLQPCEVATKDAQGLYENGDTVTVIGFCEDMATGTPEGILVYTFVDRQFATCVLWVYINRYIDSQENISLMLGTFFEIEIIYQEYATTGISHWRVLNAKEENYPIGTISSFGESL